MRLTTITPVTKFPKGQLMQIKASDTTTLQFVRNVGHSDARNNHRTKHNSSSQRNPTNFVHCGFQQKKSSFFFREQTKTEKPAFNRITHHRQVCQLTCESHAKQQNINRSELKEKKKKRKNMYISTTNKTIHSHRSNNAPQQGEKEQQTRKFSDLIFDSSLLEFILAD